MRDDNNLPSVAILLATYNGERWLNEQLDSIFAQQECTIHIFANDDGSTDATIEILKQHSRSADISITTHKKGGAGQNFIGLMQNTDFSKYDYIAFSDQDDIWMDAKLSRAISQLSIHKADAYSSNVTAFWHDGERRLIVKSQPQRKYDYMFESAGPGCTFLFNHSTAILFKTFLRDAPADQLTKITLHDWLAYGWARGNGKKWLIDDFSGLDYRQHDNNVLGASRNKTALKKRWQMVNDGWYLHQARLNIKLIGHDNIPAQFLKEGGIMNLIKTMMEIRKVRRRASEALFLSVVFILELFKSKKVDEQ